MLDIKADPEILALIDREQIKSNFDQGLETLDEITKKLNDYLEQKRQVFPWFYFLADTDLLLILA